MAPPERGSAHPIIAHYWFNDLERMKGRVRVVGWSCSGRFTQSRQKILTRNILWLMQSKVSLIRFAEWTSNTLSQRTFSILVAVWTESDCWRQTHVTTFGGRRGRTSLFLPRAPRTITPLNIPSRIASPHIGRYSSTVPLRVEGWVGLGGWLHTEVVCPPKDGHPSCAMRCYSGRV